GLDGRLLQAVEPAPGVVDQQDGPGAEVALGEHERSDDVLGHDPAGVAEDVGVAGGEVEDADGVDPGVHAGDDGQPQAGRGRDAEGPGLPGPADQLLDDVHRRGIAQEPVAEGTRQPYAARSRTPAVSLSTG